MKENRVKSFLADKAYKLVNSDLDEYEGLYPHHIKKIFYFLKYEFKIPDHRIHISKDKKVIVVEILDAEGKPCKIKPKEGHINMLNKWVDIPNYKIIFGRPDE